MGIIATVVILAVIWVVSAFLFPRIGDKTAVARFAQGITALAALILSYLTIVAFV